MYLTLQICTLKVIKMINFILFVFYCNKNLVELKEEIGKCRLILKNFSPFLASDKTTTHKESRATEKLDSIINCLIIIDIRGLLHPTVAVYTFLFQVQIRHSLKLAIS